MARLRFAPDSPLEGDGFEPSVPRRGQHFSRPPVRALGARPSAREEIGPAEKERPFRGASHRLCAPSTGIKPPGLPSSGEAMPRQEGGHEQLSYKRAQEQADEAVDGGSEGQIELRCVSAPNRDPTPNVGKASES